MLSETLKNYWFSNREAKIYLACLELWSSIASSIARKTWENRVTTYSILKELVSRWIANELEKNWVKYFSAISPEELLRIEEQKIEKLKSIMPEMLAISNAYNNKTKIYYYDWFERIKDLFIEIADEWWDMIEPFLTFVWTQDMDERFKLFLDNDFISYRLKKKNTTRAIISDKNSSYSKYYQENHDTLVIDDSIFEMWNQIVLYGTKVAVLSYNKNEIYWLVIDSKILFSWLKSMFNLIWKIRKK